MKQPALFRGSGMTPVLRQQFDAFWAAYPPRRPNPRALAERAFVAAIGAGIRPEDLVAAAQGYAAECRRKGIAEDFIVHARTFLTQRRFEDYLRAPEAPIAAVAEAAPDHVLWDVLAGKMPAAEFRMWIAKLAVMGWIPGETGILIAPTRFHRDWVRQHHAVQLQAAMRVKTLIIEAPEDVRP